MACPNGGSVDFIRSQRVGHGRYLRIAVAHGVGHEPPLSRQRCASTPIDSASAAD
jgi:hypothetical protein